MKLTPPLLRKIVEEELAKFGDEEDVEARAKKTKETDADEYADALEKHIDFINALKIEEARLQKRLKIVSEAKQRIINNIRKKG